MAEKEKKLQIIKAAAKRFDRHGLNKTTLDEIARDLRIGKATIYHYFESKDQLYYDVLEWEGSLLLEEVRVIWENPEFNIGQKLSVYFSSKEGLQVRFKLVFDALINILNDKSFEQENLFFSKLITSEEKILYRAFQQLAKAKTEQQDILVRTMISQSWNFMFAGKLNLFLENEKQNSSKDLLIKIIEENFFITK